MMLSTRRLSKPVRRSGRGSALLIVFVFAAIIAIMLYKEMPVAVFEAQRQKEELLIDRGGEYKHAIKLFVRKFQTFPPTLEALEATNRIRFLRHKFEDPFTGKADWRLIHAGPGGVLIDSKVGLDKKNKPGGPHAPNSSTETAAALNQGFGGSADSRSSSDSTQPEVILPPIPQRPPAIMASTQPTGLSSSGDLPLPDTSSSSTDPDGVANVQIVQPVGAADNTATNLQDKAAENAAANPGNQAVQSFNRLQANNASAAGNASVPYPGYPGPPMAVPAGQTAASSDSQAQSVLNQLNGQNPRGQTQQQSIRNNGGINAGGGIAGVASKAGGHTIKTVNDQIDVSLWEFCYDLRKEANALAPGLAGGAGAAGAGPIGIGPPAIVPRNTLPPPNSPDGSSPSFGPPVSGPPLGDPGPTGASGPTSGPR